MPVFLSHLTTQTPPHACPQGRTRDLLMGWTQDAKAKRLIHAVSGRSGIETRHSACGDFAEDAEATLYRKDAGGNLLSPGTAQRNALYAQESRVLAVSLARKTLESAAARFQPGDVTHIIFASCTGFVNPGPDYHIIRELGLRESVERYTLGFMGCYAAFPALRMASQFCQAHTDAVVLVMCLELCTLHMQTTSGGDQILANSLFADGAAAGLVSARQPHASEPAYALQSFASSLVTAGEADMAWDIGDSGFNLVLSSYVPELLGTHLQPLLEVILQKENLTLADIREWAVHPGGRAILDKLEQSLSLPEGSLAASRSILRDYGNMSSATVLFVLKELLEKATAPTALTCAMAFGPGLTVETAVLKRLGGVSA